MKSMFSVALSKGVLSTGFSNAKKKKKKLLTHKFIKNAPKYVKYTMKSDFYNTNEWGMVRTNVLNKHGRKCMCCGKTSGIMHVDHIKPRSKYPYLELVFDNLQVLCKDCNLSKSNLHETDYRSTVSVNREYSPRSIAGNIKTDSSLQQRSKIKK